MNLRAINNILNLKSKKEINKINNSYKNFTPSNN